MRRLSTAVIISGITGLLSLFGAVWGLYEHYSHFEIFALMLLGWIFGICLELRYAKLASDAVLGDVAEVLRRDISLRDEVREIATDASKARLLQSRLINLHLDRILQQTREQVSQLANGKLTVDLGLGGRYLPDLVDICRFSYQGTSLVAPDQYWRGPFGIESLKKCATAIKNGRTVQRVFLEERAHLSALSAFVYEHQQVGVICRIAVIEDLDDGLQKDFAIIDNEAAVELEIHHKRNWTKAWYCVDSGKAGGCADLHRLQNVWRSLWELSEAADDFLRKYPLAQPIAATTSRPLPLP